MDDVTLSKLFNHCVAIFGDTWTLLIMSALLEQGELRFAQLQRAIPGISPTTLSNRLKKLEAHALINRLPETLDRQSVSYALTEKGQALHTVIGAIREYADAHLTPTCASGGTCSKNLA